MPIKKLVSHQEVPMFIPEFYEAFLADHVTGETLHKFGSPFSVRTSIVVKLLQEGDDPVFVLGEAMQSPDDIFNRKTGHHLAETRADLRREHKEDVNWITFSLSEAKTMTQDFFEREDRGEVMQVSSVKLPISDIPLPHGVVNRLRMLLPK